MQNRYEDDYPPEYFVQRPDETDGEFITRLKDVVADLHSCDVPRIEIESFLLKRGMCPENAKFYTAWTREAEKEKGQSVDYLLGKDQLRSGITWFVVGAAATGVGYLLAAPGGTYFALTGAMFWGAAKIIGGILDIYNFRNRQ